MDQRGYDPRISRCKRNVLPIRTTGPNMKTIEKECLECNQPMTVRFADHSRGRARFCSHSCAAIHGNKHRIRLFTPNCVCAQCNGSFYRNTSKQKNSKSGLQFCDRRCKELAQRIGGIEIIQPDHYNNGSGPRFYRVKALRHYPHQCNRCGYSKCLSVIEAHHKDRNRSNNKLENLELLCRNCHGEEHHMD